MMDASKYRVGYFPVGKKYKKWVEKDHIENMGEGMMLVGCKQCGELIIKKLRRG